MTPFVGCGATYQIGTDEHPCTIVRVEAGGKRVGVVLDTVYGRGVFSPASTDAEPERWFLLVADDYRLEGRSYGRLKVGVRSFVRDPSFGPDRESRFPHGPVT